MDDRGVNHRNVTPRTSGRITNVIGFSQILALVIGQRSRIIEESERKAEEGSPEPDEDGLSVALPLKEPSEEASAKFTDHCGPFCLHNSRLLLNYHSVIPYTSEEQADAATKNPNLKLLFRLSKFYILDEGERFLCRSAHRR